MYNGNIALYRTEEHNTKYRRSDDKGEFFFCPCDRITCRRNTAGEGQWCGFCTRRMRSTCLIAGDGYSTKYGCCRICFLQKEPQLAALYGTKKSRGPNRLSKAAKKRQQDHLDMVNGECSYDEEATRKALDHWSRALDESDHDDDYHDTAIINDHNDDTDTPSAVTTSVYIAPIIQAPTMTPITSTICMPVMPVAELSSHTSEGTTVPDLDLQYDNLGRIVIPKPKHPYQTIELQAFKTNASISVETENLWTLLCFLSHRNFNDVHPGASFDSAERYQLLYRFMTEAKANYPNTNEGRAILSYFCLDPRTGLPNWPIELHDYIDDLNAKGIQPATLQSWRNMAKCPLKPEEKAHMSLHIQLEVFIGSKIADRVAAAVAIFNNGVNSQWPKHSHEWKSGESKAGLLFLIRKWYYIKVDCLKRAKSNAQTAISKQLRNDKNLVMSDARKEEIRVEKENEYIAEYSPKWYPDWWVTWFCYGPPIFNNHPDFRNKMMQSISRTHDVADHLSFEDQTKLIGSLSNKAARRMQPEHSVIESSKQSVKGTTADSDSGAIGRTHHVLEVVRSNGNPIDVAFDNVISSLRETIELMSVHDPQNAKLPSLKTQLIDTLVSLQIFLKFPFTTYSLTTSR